MLDDIIKKRRSIRSFYSFNIPPEYVLKIIEAGLYAPSAGDLQPWTFIIIKDEEKKEKLAELTEEEWIVGANVIIAVIGNKKNYDLYFGKESCKLLNQSIGACIENMLLKATELGVGSCWVSGFEEEPVNELLNVPNSKTCLALVALGIPAITPKKKTVKSLFVSVFWDKYGNKYKGEIENLDIKSHLNLIE